MLAVARAMAEGDNAERAPRMIQASRRPRLHPSSAAPMRGTTTSGTGTSTPSSRMAGDGAPASPLARKTTRTGSTRDIS